MKKHKLKMIIAQQSADIASRDKGIRLRDETIARLREENEQYRRTLLEAMRKIEEIVKL